MAETFDFRVEQAEKGLVILRFSGSFEGLGAIQAAERLRHAVSENTAENIFVDLSLVDYIDSSAISTLLQMAKRSVEAKKKLSIIGANENVKKVLGITKVDKIIPCLDAL